MLDTKAVTLPEGCFGLSMDDGTKYNADRHGRVHVAEHHARDINRSWAGGAGLVTPSAPTRIATRGTRWCHACTPARAWQAWTLTCPRCGEPTITERPHP